MKRNHPVVQLNVLVTGLLLFFGFAHAGSADEYQKYLAREKTSLQSSLAPQPEAVERVNELTRQPPWAYIFAQDISQANPHFQLVSRFNSAVARLDIYWHALDVSASCTITRLDHQHLITARHCLDRDLPLNRTTQSEKLSLKLETAFEVGRVGPTVNLNLASLSVLLHPTADVAMIVAPEQVPVDLGTYFPGYRFPVPGEALVLISHPMGMKKRVSNARCSVSETFQPGNAVFRHGCQTASVSSGALLVALSDGLIVGVHKEVPRGGGPGTATVLPAPWFNKPSSAPAQIPELSGLMSEDEIGWGLVEAVEHGRNLDALKAYLSEVGISFIGSREVSGRLVEAITNEPWFGILDRRILTEDVLKSDFASELFWASLYRAKRDPGAPGIRPLSPAQKFVIDYLAFGPSIKPRAGLGPCQDSGLGEMRVILREMGGMTKC